MARSARVRNVCNAPRRRQSLKAHQEFQSPKASASPCAIEVHRRRLGALPSLSGRMSFSVPCACTCVTSTATMLERRAYIRRRLARHRGRFRLDNPKGRVSRNASVAAGCDRSMAGPDTIRPPSLDGPKIQQGDVLFPATRGYVFQRELHPVQTYASQFSAFRSAARQSSRTERRTDRKDRTDDGSNGCR